MEICINNVIKICIYANLFLLIVMLFVCLDQSNVENNEKLIDNKQLNSNKQHLANDQMSLVFWYTISFENLTASYILNISL